MLIDTHCHLTYPELRDQLAGVMDRARQAGVTACINVATSPAEVTAAVDVLRAHADVHLAAGIHPHEAGKVTDDDLARLRAIHTGEVAVPRLVAVGETGLDFHYDFAAPDRQEAVFRAQLALAVETNRPVIIHARKAEEDVLTILKDYPHLVGRVVFHCFSGDRALADKVLDAGYWMSFTGVVTFRNADAVRAAALAAPLDRIMIETDAPFLSPEPQRKHRINEPALMVHTARRLADLRGMTLDELANVTSANARRFFGLGESSI